MYRCIVECEKLLISLKLEDNNKTIACFKNSNNNIVLKLDDKLWSNIESRLIGIRQNLNELLNNKKSESQRGLLVLDQARRKF